MDYHLHSCQERFKRVGRYKGEKMLHLDSWLQKNLVCPRDRLPLEIESEKLTCTNGHCYPIVEGIPILLLDDVQQTHGNNLHFMVNMADSVYIESIKTS